MPKQLKTDGMKKCIGCYTCMFTCAGINQGNHSISKSAIKIKTKAGMQSNFVALVCVACAGEPACFQACPSGALEKRTGGGVNFFPDACIGCRKCENACIVSAVQFDKDQEHPIICKHCGICARYCPHGCLRMEDAPDVL